MEIDWPALTIKHGVTTGSQRCEGDCMYTVFVVSFPMIFFPYPEVIMMMIQISDD